MTKKKYTQPSMLNREELSQNYTGCNIGQILRQRRTELGYTQRDIAWQCKLYEIEVSKLEHSPRVPPENLKSHAHLKSICGTLGLPYSDLMELLKDDVTPRRDTYQEKSRQPADTFEKYWHLTVPLIFKQRRIDLKYTWEDVAEKTGLNLSEVKEYESVTNVL